MIEGLPSQSRTLKVCHLAWGPRAELGPPLPPPACLRLVQSCRWAATPAVLTGSLLPLSVDGLLSVDQLHSAVYLLLLCELGA